MDNPMMQQLQHGGQQGHHPSPYFISSYSGGGGGGADHKLFNNPLISGGLNLSQNGLSSSSNGTNSVGLHQQYHHPIVIPMSSSEIYSMVDRHSSAGEMKMKRELGRDRSPPLTSSDGSFETDDNESSSWTADPMQGSTTGIKAKKRRRTTTESTSTTRSSMDVEDPNQPGLRLKFSSRDGGADRRTFACELCPKRFAQKAGLIQHERRHSGERPFECKHCDKKFTQKSGLVQHERLHTGDKPYECTECDKKFTQKSGLVQHVRTHTGEKPYKCNVCGKCFTQLSGLKQHGKVHSRVSSS